jgi:hypothetical protein
MLPQWQDSTQMIGKLTTHALTMTIPPDDNEEDQQQQCDNYNEGGGNVILLIPRGDAARED